MANTRQRTGAKVKAEGADAKDTALIQDSQEQEQEIKKLRRENASSNDQAQVSLDVGVITNLLLTGLQASTSLSQPDIRNFVALAQFVLLPFCITPSKLPFLKWATPFYNYVFRVQVVLALTAIWQLYEHHQLSIPAVFRWSLPAIVAGGVAIQRNSEKEAEVRLARLEKLKYRVDGA